MNSQAVVVATAMVVSSTFLFLAFSKPKSLSSSSSSESDTQNREDSKDTLPPNQTLRSCLYSEEKKKQRKKKRVRFAENLKETNGNGEKYRKESYQNRKKSVTKVGGCCRNEIPANRIALYNGILRDRVHRMQCSY